MSKAPKSPPDRELEPVAPPAASSQSLMRLDPQALLTLALQHNAAIDTVERLVALAKDARAIQAKEAFHRALTRFQRICPPILKTKTATIRTARASYTYTFAPLPDIMRTIRPALDECGLTVSWRGHVASQNAVAVCRIAHELGHVEESGEMSMPIGAVDDGRGASPPQRVASAMSYAKRHSLLMGLGITPEDEDDEGTGVEDAGAEAPLPVSDYTPPQPAEHTVLATSITAAAAKRGLTDEERLVLSQERLKGKRIGAATVDELRQLEMFLNDPEAVKAWRAERAQKTEP